MKLAVMQPYLFPYVGYFQLIYASDVFVLYDDVAYIKRGYVNRNSILLNGQANRFILPVPGGSPNKKINDLSYSYETTKILEKIRHAYSKAEYYKEVFPIIEESINFEDRRIGSLCLRSYELIFSYLGVKRLFLKSSDISYKSNMSAEDKLIDLSKKNKASHYINPIGGAGLYSKENFYKKGVVLSFLIPRLEEYKQLGVVNFMPGLSFIDCLMNCSTEEVRSLLSVYDIV